MAKRKVPMTLLCGYLGAGKTTLLNKVLGNQQGLKVAVIVNDIGEVNVDERLIRDGAKITDSSSIVPLTNGCICCTLKTDLVRNIENLIRTGAYDYVLIEASGVCEPMPIAQSLEQVSNGRLDNIVGVVDAKRLVDEFGSGRALLRKDIDEEDIESLLVQQIEFCSTLVINKKDLVSEEEFAAVRAVIGTLHPGVKIIETSRGDVPVADMLGTGSFDFDTVYSAAGWCRALEADDDDDDEHDEHGHDEDGLGHHHHEHRHEGSDTDEYGIGTFIYRSRRAFDRAKLDSYAARWPSSIIRCKGLMWFADEPDMALIFETSGRQISAGYSGQWIAACSPDERKRILAENPAMMDDWDETVGDRMIRLCVIGRDMDRARITADLDACTVEPSL